MICQLNIQIVTFGVDLDIAEVSDQGPVPELFGWAGGEERDDLHAGAEAGVDAGAGVFEDKAILGFDAELRSGVKEAFWVGLAVLDFIDGDDYRWQRESCGEDACLGELAPG